MSVNVTAVDNLFTPAPPWLKRQRPELNGYFIQIQTANGDGSAGTWGGTLQLPTNMAKRYGWRLVHVTNRCLGAGGDRTVSFRYQITLPGQASSFSVEWEETLTATAGTTNRFRSHLDFFVVGRDFPVPLERPTDVQLIWLDVNGGAGASFVVTAVYEQYGVEPFKG